MSSIMQSCDGTTDSLRRQASSSSMAVAAMPLAELKGSRLASICILLEKLPSYLLAEENVSGFLFQGT
jgi:hypothetical protein